MPCESIWVWYDAPSGHARAGGAPDDDDDGDPGLDAPRYKEEVVGGGGGGGMKSAGRSVAAMAVGGVERADAAPPELQVILTLPR